MIIFVLLALFYIPIILATRELSYEQTLLVYSLFSVMSFVAILRMTKINWLLNNVGFGHRTVNKMRKLSHAIQNSFTNTRLSTSNNLQQAHH